MLGLQAAHPAGERLSLRKSARCAPVGEAANELRVDSHSDRLRAILGVERGPSGPIAFASGGHAATMLASPLAAISSLQARNPRFHALSR